MKGCLCTEERGNRICYFTAAHSPWPHRCWLSRHFISLGATEKAGRSLTNSATFTIESGRGRWRSHGQLPLPPGDMGCRKEGGSRESLKQSCLASDKVCTGFKCLPARHRFFGLHYFPQEEATWKWQLPCNLGTSWKTVITHHIIITRHCSLPFGTLASVSSILKFLPCPERQDKAFEMVSWCIFVSSSDLYILHATPWTSILIFI